MPYPFTDKIDAEIQRLKALETAIKAEFKEKEHSTAYYQLLADITFAQQDLQNKVNAYSAQIQPHATQYKAILGYDLPAVIAFDKEIKNLLQHIAPTEQVETLLVKANNSIPRIQIYYHAGKYQFYVDGKNATQNPEAHFDVDAYELKVKEVHADIENARRQLNEFLKILNTYQALEQWVQTCGAQQGFQQFETQSKLLVTQLNSNFKYDPLHKNIPLPELSPALSSSFSLASFTTGWFGNSLSNFEEKFKAINHNANKIIDHEINLFCMFLHERTMYADPALKTYERIQAGIKEKKLDISQLSVYCDNLLTKTKELENILHAQDPIAKGAIEFMQKVQNEKKSPPPKDQPKDIVIGNLNDEFFDSIEVVQSVNTAVKQHGVNQFKLPKFEDQLLSPVEVKSAPTFFKKYGFFCGSILAVGFLENFLFSFIFPEATLVFMIISILSLLVLSAILVITLEKVTEEVREKEAKNETENDVSDYVGNYLKESIKDAGKILDQLGSEKNRNSAIGEKSVPPLASVAPHSREITPLPQQPAQTSTLPLQ